VEFWQGRENRVHNRIRVEALAGGPVTSDNCRIERLQP
jgi:pyridoxamine 5'-phosphate oxidase